MNRSALRGSRRRPLAAGGYDRPAVPRGMTAYIAAGLVGAAGLGLCACSTITVKVQRDGQGQIKDSGRAGGSPAVFLKGGQMQFEAGAAAAAAGAVENPDSRWVMVTHEGRALYVNQDTGAPTLQVPAEGFANQQATDGQQFTALSEQAAKYDDGTYSPLSKWVKLMHGDRVMYVNKDSMAGTLVEPEEGILTDENFPDKKQFNELYSRAEKRDAGLMWVKFTLGAQAVYINPETAAATLKAPAEGVLEEQACPPADKARFVVMRTRATKMDAGKTEWLELTNGGRSLFHDQVAERTTLVKPATLLGTHELEAAKFDELYAKAGKDDAKSQPSMPGAGGSAGAVGDDDID